MNLSDTNNPKFRDDKFIGQPTLEYLTFDDIVKNRKELIDKVNSQPDFEQFYFIPQIPVETDSGGWILRPMHDPQKNCNESEKWKINSIISGGPFFIIAGSAVLYPLVEILTQHKPKWRNNDTDMFFLRQIKNSRVNTGAIDFVYNTAKSPEELLLNFDLPCCRVGYNPTQGTWISLQCLVSILTGKYYLPTYVNNRFKFSQLLTTHRKPHGNKIIDTNGNFQLSDLESLIYQRFHQRIRKYSERGFSPVLYSTSYVLPWIISRFHYGEWKMSDKIFEKMRAPEKKSESVSERVTEEAPEKTIEKNSEKISGETSERSILSLSRTPETSNVPMGINGSKWVKNRKGIPQMNSNETQGNPKSQANSNFQVNLTTSTGLLPLPKSEHDPNSSKITREKYVPKPKNFQDSYPQRIPHNHFDSGNSDYKSRSSNISYGHYVSNSPHGHYVSNSPHGHYVSNSPHGHYVSNSPHASNGSHSSPKRTIRYSQIIPTDESNEKYFPTNSQNFKK